LTAPTTTPTIAPGHYRHYKGNEYEVIDTATHSETHELMVVYRPLQNDKSEVSKLWVRPAAMFAENVVIDGLSQPRFAKL
jgi:hypothetical protein